MISDLLAREEERFEATHPRSREFHERAGRELLSGVPMNWMTRWPGPYPIVVERAEGAEIVDIDGNAYVDLCLGDTGAMCGHSPRATVEVVERQMRRGITTMLPKRGRAAPSGFSSTTVSSTVPW